MKFYPKFHNLEVRRETDGIIFFLNSQFIYLFYSQFRVQTHMAHSWEQTPYVTEEHHQGSTFILDTKE